MRYQQLLAPLDGFAASVHRFIAEGGKGANVTLPFKLEACALASILSSRARAAGAVNTLYFQGGEIVGDNTDGIGLVTDIVKNAGQALAGKRVLLLGAGGAARGVLLPLLQEQPAELVIANRSAARAVELVLQMRQQPGFSGYLAACKFDALQGRFDFIINATSASLAAKMPPLAPTLFGPETLAYDMMYGKDATIFMRYAAQQGAQVRDGLGMLVEQAAASFFLWRGVQPQTASVFAALRATR